MGKKSFITLGLEGERKRDGGRFTGEQEGGGGEGEVGQGVGEAEEEGEVEKED